MNFKYLLYLKKIKKINVVFFNSCIFCILRGEVVFTK